MRRTRRCAQIKFTEVATRKGSMPIFIKRLMVEGASLVCNVESTKWPVRAAFTPISAVSKSRISPTRMILGKSRSEEHTSELQSRRDLVCRLLLEKTKHTLILQPHQ